MYKIEKSKGIKKLVEEEGGREGNGDEKRNNYVLHTCTNSLQEM